MIQSGILIQSGIAVAYKGPDGSLRLLDNSHLVSVQQGGDAPVSLSNCAENCPAFDNGFLQQQGQDALTLTYQLSDFTTAQAGESNTVSVTVPLAALATQKYRGFYLVQAPDFTTQQLEQPYQVMGGQLNEANEVVAPLSQQQGDRVEMLNAQQQVFSVSLAQLTGESEEPVQSRAANAQERERYAEQQQQLQAAASALLGKNFLWQEDFNTGTEPDVDQELAYDFSLESGRVTTQRGDHFSDVGGLEKILPLPARSGVTRAYAAMDIEAAFAEDPSETYLTLEFYNAAQQNVATYTSAIFKGNRQGTALLEGVEVPADAVTVHVIPLVKLAATETGRFYWDNLRFALLDQ